MQLSFHPTFAPFYSVGSQEEAVGVENGEARIVACPGLRADQEMQRPSQPPELHVQIFLWGGVASVDLLGALSFVCVLHPSQAQLRHWRDIQESRRTHGNKSMFYHTLG
jgi:hypothetical protein